MGSETGSSQKLMGQPVCSVETVSFGTSGGPCLRAIRQIVISYGTNVLLLPPQVQTLTLMTICMSTCVRTHTHHHYPINKKKGDRVGREVATQR